MDSMTAFSMGNANRGRAMKVFDWDQAAEIIRDRKPVVASAGLSGDWEWTGGDIYRDGAPIDPGETYVYLASTWATPELVVDGDVIECFRMESDAPGWDAETYWPDTALAILADTPEPGR